MSQDLRLEITGSIVTILHFLLETQHLNIIFLDKQISWKLCLMVIRFLGNEHCDEVSKEYLNVSEECSRSQISRLCPHVIV